jgi:hypothetical protein
VSITEPTTSRAARDEQATPPPGEQLARGRGAALAARADALATRRNGLLLLGAAALALLVAFLVRPTYPNYDSYWSLLWGRELADGRLPDYDVFRPPTPHPLATFVGAVLSWLGAVADRVLVLVGLGSWLALLAVLFRFAQRLLGTLVAVVAGVWLLTRTDIAFFSFRAMVDVPFLALVFGAAVLELGRPRRGLSVLGLLALAGLLRPEAWVLSGLYWLWLVPALDRRKLVGYAALAAAAPVLWLASDWIVTGEPLYSLTSTRDVAGEFGRQRGLLDAITLVPQYVGANEKIVNVAVGGLGALMALWLLRRRAALPVAMAAIGLVVFLAIAAVGLSVIPRYLAIPSLILNLCVAVALTSWAIVEGRGERRAAIVLAVVSLAVLGWRAPALVEDLQQLNGQTFYVKNQHQGLKAALSDARVVPLLRECRPVIVPNHSSIPVIRFETGLPQRALQPSIVQRRPPRSGVLLLANQFNFEPNAGRAVTGAPSVSARKWWSNYPLSTFDRLTGNPTWRVYERC